MDLDVKIIDRVTIGTYNMIKIGNTLIILNIDLINFIMDQIKESIQIMVDEVSVLNVKKLTMY